MKLLDLPPCLDASRRTPRYRQWSEEAHRFVFTAIERGTVSALLETKLFEGHELETKLALGRYRGLFEPELVQDAIVDTYLHFRRDFLVLARSTPKAHAQFFCKAVRNRIISAHRRWGARIEGEVDGTSDEDTITQDALITPSIDGRAEAAETLAKLRALASADRHPTRRAAILARLDGDEPEDIALRLMINRATERSWFLRFRDEAEAEGLLLAAG
jgi:hypothetical protein